MDLKELESGVDPATHWYYQSKKKPLFRYFEECTQGQGGWTVVDFGSGSGFFAYELEAAYGPLIKEVLLVDIGYTTEELAATANDKIKKLHAIPQGLERCIVVMMDVLEHIEDDGAILDLIRRSVGREAYYFITVPAFMSVWSSHDVYLGHYRRYTLPTLGQLLGRTGCQAKRLYYIYGSIFPLVWLLRRLKRNEDNMKNPQSSDMAPLPGPLNALLRWYNGAEMGLSRANRLFGLTAVSEGRL